MKIPDDELANLKTVGDAVGYIEKAQAAADRARRLPAGAGRGRSGRRPRAAGRARTGSGAAGS